MEAGLREYLPAKDEYPQNLNEAMNYAVFSGGKRLRPILFFATYEILMGRKNLNRLNRVLPAAVALELVHNASLVHDDLPSMDNSLERRGLPSVHIKYSPATAILAGDALITKAFEVLTDIKNRSHAVKCIDVLTRALSTRGMIGGQAVDLISQNKKININVLKYIHMKKTGALLQAAIEMACVLNDTEENLTITLGNYALNLGLAYQIVDDVLDEVGTYEVLGKEPGSDARGNKATYPSLIGLEKSKKTAEKLLRDCYNLIKNMEGNEVLIEYINQVKERLP
ncbi:MAG: polyprenyl synthetase family protein [Candidatus Stygibacter australis]|nr:polyprenyl synthetase family protein [Candidatus Stygibacter australis]MDP8322814.1 polyprenyl synthetase family protein [Candidatus Stygibacter australis]